MCLVSTLWFLRVTFAGRHGGWNTSGCLTELRDRGTLCCCDHLTFFTLLMVSRILCTYCFYIGFCCLLHPELQRPGPICAGAVPYMNWHDGCTFTPHLRPVESQPSSSDKAGLHLSKPLVSNQQQTQPNTFSGWMVEGDVLQLSIWPTIPRQRDLNSRLPSEVLPSLYCPLQP